MGKLVRDNIPSVALTDMKGLLSNGQVVSFRKLVDDDEFLDAMCAKLREECEEVCSALEIADDAQVREEIADVLEVLQSIAVHLGLSFEIIEQIRQHKAMERGSFRHRVFLED